MSTPLTPFSQLAWESRWVERLPGDPEKGNFTRPVKDIAYSETLPTPVTAPKLVGWSDALGQELGIARPTANDLASIELLAGNRILPAMRPYAARYGGHQFGHWAGQLGDGRAITLGEVTTARAGRQEFQLKGAGPTPYSRRADGRAVLRSSIREFLCSESMHALGVPTTRALSLVTTGEDVVRDLFYDGNPKPEPGAIVCRVAPSFLRFGNFQILATHGETELLKKLTDLLIEDHYPQFKGDSDAVGKLLDEICVRTARMISWWMCVGFVHGVMNTDNMSALGLTIDYGPYGWLEPFDPTWTPNTTDAQGRRYRYGNQPNIALWNLARLAEAWLPLLPREERAHESLALYQSTFDQVYREMLAQKLGLKTIETDDDISLVHEMFDLMGAVETDFTIFFRALCDWKPGEDLFIRVTPAFYSPESVDSALREKWAKWSERYGEKLKHEALPANNRAASMKKANPKYVLRNYLAQNAITAAEKGDLSVLERLQRVLSKPYDDQSGEDDLAQRRPEWARHAPGCSALSCSS